MVCYNGTFIYDSLNDRVLAQHRVGCRDRRFNPASVPLARTTAIGLFTRTPRASFLGCRREQHEMERFWADRPEDPEPVRVEHGKSWRSTTCSTSWRSVQKKHSNAWSRGWGRTHGELHPSSATGHLPSQDFYPKLEPKLASKAEAVRQLKHLLGATRCRGVRGQPQRPLDVYDRRRKLRSTDCCGLEVPKPRMEVIDFNSNDGVVRGGRSQCRPGFARHVNGDSGLRGGGNCNEEAGSIRQSISSMRVEEPEKVCVFCGGWTIFRGSNWLKTLRKSRQKSAENGRRMGDSNPRGLAPNTLSKRAP